MHDKIVRMRTIGTRAHDDIASLIASRKAGHTLDQAFYRDPDIFELDMDVLAHKWTLIDHASRLPKKGDYLVVDLGAADSYIIVRGNDDQIRGFHNVCRHRGSRLCDSGEGHTSLFVCPYHSWSYRLDGSNKAAREMPPEFDGNTHGLVEVGVRVMHGLIFLSPEGDEKAFDASYGSFGDVLDFHGIGQARIAAQRSYPTAANWKLVVENFLECYHCVGAHPEYSTVHSRAKLEAFGAGAGSGDPAAVAAFQPELDAWSARVADLGHPTGFFESDHTSAHMAQMGRSPIGPGQLSETQDGSLASHPLMGSYGESDGGQTGFSFSPVGYLLANCDFAFMIVFRPRGPLQTDVEATWLVHEDASEADVDIDKMVWVWDTTLRQDKKITVDNQQGVMSRGYQPGPYAMSEARSDTFVQWYLAGLEDLVSDQALTGSD